MFFNLENMNQSFVELTLLFTFQAKSTWWLLSDKSLKTDLKQRKERFAKLLSSIYLFSTFVAYYIRSTSLQTVQLSYALREKKIKTYCKCFYLASFALNVIVAVSFFTSIQQYFSWFKN